MPRLGSGTEPMPFRPGYWARGRRDGRGGGRGARHLPDPSPRPSTAHDTHHQLPGAPSELQNLTGPCSGPPGLPENCLLYWNILATPPTTTHTIPPDGVTCWHSHFLLLRGIAMEPQKAGHTSWVGPMTGDQKGLCSDSKDLDSNSMLVPVI